MIKEVRGEVLGEATWRRSSLPVPGANYTEAPGAHRCLLAAPVGSPFEENLPRALDLFTSPLVPMSVSAILTNLGLRILDI